MWGFPFPNGQCCPTARIEEGRAEEIFTCPSELLPQAYTSPVDAKASVCSAPTATSSMTTPARTGICCGRLWLRARPSGKPIKRSEKITRGKVHCGSSQSFQHTSCHSSPFSANSPKTCSLVHICHTPFFILYSLAGILDSINKALITTIMQFVFKPTLLSPISQEFEIHTPQWLAAYFNTCI